MANVSGAVQIETGIKHGLSIPFQSVAGEQSIDVGTLLIIGIYLFEFNSENFPLAKYIRETRIVSAHRADCSNAANWISPAVA